LGAGKWVICQYEFLVDSRLDEIQSMERKREECLKRDT
jgi:hypothetical protein